jgi:hypothetical protein
MLNALQLHVGLTVTELGGRKCNGAMPKPTWA